MNMDLIATPYFWPKRSDSKAYQNAYKLLAEKIPFQYTGVVTDIACGPGRLIAKLYPKMKKGVIVGTDKSDEMLDIAATYLNGLRVPVKRYTNPMEIDFQRPGVHLVKDDFICTELPNEFSCRTFFTFPEIDPFGYNLNANDKDLISRALKFFKFDLNDPLAATTLMRLRADYNLVRITKRNGKIIRTGYAQFENHPKSKHNSSLLQSLNSRSEFLGLTLTDFTLREDDDIWSDMRTRGLEDKLIKAMNGYSLTVEVKN